MTCEEATPVENKLFARTAALEVILKILVVRMCDAGALSPGALQEVRTDVFTRINAFSFAEDDGASAAMVMVREEVERFFDIMPAEPRVPELDRWLDDHATKRKSNGQSNMEMTMTDKPMAPEMIDVYARLAFNQGLLVQIVALMATWQPDRGTAMAELSQVLLKLRTRVADLPCAKGLSGADVGALFPRLENEFLELVRAALPPLPVGETGVCKGQVGSHGPETQRN